MIHMRKYATASEVYVPLLAAGTPDFKSNPTIAAGDFTLEVDGVNFGVADTLPTLLPAGGYMVKIPISVAETTGKTLIIRVIDAAGAEWEDQMVIVETYGHASARHPFDLGTAMSGQAVASVTGAVGSVAGAVGSVTGNVGGNVTGSVGSVVAAVVTDAASRTASQADVSALASQASVDAVQGATFDTATDSLEAIRNRGDAAWTGGGGGLTAQQVEDAVWDAMVADHLDAGSMGKNIDDLPYTGIFITGFANAGTGTVSGQTYLSPDTEPSGHILTGGESDDDTVTLTAEIHTLGGIWQPLSVDLYRDDVALNLDIVRADWTQLDDRVFQVTFTVSDATASATYHVQTSDGKVSGDFAYVRAANPPDVTLAEWGQYTDPAWSALEYPTTVLGSQTAVKAGDTIDIKCTIDINCDEIRVSGTGINNQTFSAGYTAGIVYLEGVVVSSATGSYAITVDARQSGGSYGASDATSNILLDQAGHTHDSVISNITHSLGGSYWALASGQNLTADFTITNWSAGNDGDVTYVASEVTISADTTYTLNKTYTYVTGTYRDSGTNVTLTSRRKANGKQTVKTYLVKIANTSPTLTMTGATTRLRSSAAGDQNYALTLTGSQELMNTPTCLRDAGDDGDALFGAWTGSAPDKTWTHTLVVGEEDMKGVYTWATVLATNGAGKTVSAIGTNPTYTIGGFIERDVAVAKFTTFEAIGTTVSGLDNPAKLVMSYVGLGDGTYVTNTTDDPGSKKFTIVDAAGNFDADGGYVKCNDSNIYDATAYTMRIEESQ